MYKTFLRAGETLEYHLFKKCVSENDDRSAQSSNIMF